MKILNPTFSGQQWIIKQIVNPRKTSKAVKRDAMVLVEVVDVIFLAFVQVN
jgi:hypothetical protein